MKRTCLKDEYQSKRDAMRAADRIEFRIKRRLYPYICPFCGSYHLTKIKKGDYKL